jgi:hypothetical protein
MPLTAAELAAQILAAHDLGILRVKVKEWNDMELGIRVMTVGERDAYEREWIGKRETGIENFRAKFLARCLCHPESGERIFTDEQVGELAAKSAKVVSTLFDKAMTHNAMSEQDVEELAKN